MRGRTPPAGSRPSASQASSTGSCRSTPKGEVIRPAKLWCDTSTAAQCDTLIAPPRRPAAHHRTLGNAIPPGFTASKILWLKEHEPEQLRPAGHGAPAARLPGLLAHRATRTWNGATHPARRCWTCARGRWSSGRCAAIDPDLAGKLPPLVALARAGRTLSSRTSRGSWACRGDVVVSAGGGDNMMGAIGTGNVARRRRHGQPRHSGTIYACSARARRGPGRRSRGVLRRDRAVAAAGVHDERDGGHRDGAEAVRLSITPQLRGRGRRCAPGADGLLLLRSSKASGRRTCPTAPGCGSASARAPATPAHMARAAMEGATLGLNYGLNRLRALGLAPREIRLTGGGSRSAAWRQIAADVFDCPVVCPGDRRGRGVRGGAPCPVGAGAMRTAPDGRSRRSRATSSRWTTRPGPCRIPRRRRATATCRTSSTTPRATSPARSRATAASSGVRPRTLGLPPIATAARFVGERAQQRVVGLEEVVRRREDEAAVPRRPRRRPRARPAASRRACSR